MSNVCTGLNETDPLYKICKCPQGLDPTDSRYSACDCAQGVRSLDKLQQTYNNLFNIYKEQIKARDDYLKRKTEYDSFIAEQLENYQNIRPLGQTIDYGAVFNYPSDCGGCNGNTFSDINGVISRNGNVNNYDKSIFNNLSSEGLLQYVGKETFQTDWLGNPTRCYPICKISVRGIDKLMSDFNKQFPPPQVVDVPKPPSAPNGNYAINCCSNYMNVPTVNKIENVLQNCNQSIVQTLDKESTTQVISTTGTTKPGTTKPETTKTTTTKPATTKPEPPKPEPPKPEPPNPEPPKPDPPKPEPDTQLVMTIIWIITGVVAVSLLIVAFLYFYYFNRKI